MVGSPIKSVPHVYQQALVVHHGQVTVGNADVSKSG